MNDRLEINKFVGQAIKEARKSKNISQEKMALLSNIDRTYASALERGLKNPSLEVLLKISEGLDYPASKIVSRVEELVKGSLNQ
jgi:transcriptional regulator with XRE-family HTH domain